MSTEQTSDRPGGAVAEMKRARSYRFQHARAAFDEGSELGEDVSVQVRGQLDQRST